ncbi:MAG TPA: hypothetical protein VHC19_29990, partial [Pirellulales bacterium]|nr:hypothetical protein [Pirellulales bacterium]
QSGLSRRPHGSRAPIGGSDVTCDAALGGSRRRGDCRRGIGYGHRRLDPGRQNLSRLKRLKS